MKKSIFFVLLLFGIIISIPIIILENRCRLIFISLDLLIILFIYGWWREKEFLKIRLPNLLNSDRNFEKLLICDEFYIKYINTEKTLVISNYNRSFHGDFLIFKRYYSFLNKNGETLFVFDFKNKNYFESKRIDSLDYNFLHIVTLYEQGIRPEKKLFKFKKILNKYKIIIYRMYIYKLLRRSEANINEVEKCLEQLENFANERKINLKILIKNKNNIEQLENKFRNIKFQKI